jgi:hypothetical protein
LTCANVANLLLARATGREQEMALRTALGAGRARIAGQLVAESAVLALISGAAGVAVAMIGIRALHVLRPPDEFPLDGLAIDGRVLLFALVVTAVTGLAFGLVPVLKGTASRTAGALQEGLRSTGARGRRRASQALVVAEIALALLLVSAAGLMLRSFVALRQVDPGFRVEDRVTASLVLPRESRRPYGPLVRVARRCAACCRCLPAGISWKCAGAMSTPRVLRPPQGRGASRECES